MTFCSLMTRFISFGPDAGEVHVRQPQPLRPARHHRAEHLLHRRLALGRDLPLAQGVEPQNVKNIVTSSSIAAAPLAMMNAAITLSKSPLKTMIVFLDLVSVLPCLSISADVGQAADRRVDRAELGQRLRRTHACSWRTARRTPSTPPPSSAAGARAPSPSSAPAPARRSGRCARRSRAGSAHSSPSEAMNTPSCPRSRACRIQPGLMPLVHGMLITETVAG